MSDPNTLNESIGFEDYSNTEWHPTDNPPTDSEGEE
jgi:hypothetical protein